MSLRVVFMGTRGGFSLPPLESLIAAGIDVRGVIVPGGEAESSPRRLAPAPSPSPLPLLTPYVTRSIVELAWQHGIPVYESARGAHESLSGLLQALEAAVVCVACWPWRVPESLLRAPRHGFLNVHPSLLPQHRGPAPLFWTFRAGESRAGATIHRMDAGFDTGPIALRDSFTIPDGISGPELERRCAELGGRLLVETIERLARDDLAFESQPAGGSYERWPREEDFAIASDWTARRAFNFVRGTRGWQMPYHIRTAAGEVILIHDAIGYDADQRLTQPIQRADGITRIQLRQGVLIARETDDA